MKNNLPIKSRNKFRFLQNTLALSAVTLIIVVWATVTFFAYQTKLLRNNTQINPSNGSAPEAELHQEDNAGWKTYINNYHGYSFKYPGNWEIHSSGSDAPENAKSIYLASLDYKSGIDFKTELFGSKIQTFEENAEFWRTYYMSSTAELGNAQTEIVKEENITIDGVGAIKNTISYQFEAMKNPGIAVWMYIPLSGKQLLSIKYYSENSSKQEFKLYGQILSTFKFNNR